MTALTDYARLTRGLDLLRDVYEIDRRHPNSVELVSAAAHVFESTASAWLTAARSWFGSGNDDALAEAESLPLDTLIAISRAIYKAAPELREELRTELARSAHGKTPEAVRAHAKQKLKETVTAKVTNTMTISHEADVMGMKHAHLRLREAQMNELQARALAVTSLNRNEPVAVRLADGLLKLLSGTSPDYSDHFNRSLTPAIMLTIDDSTYVGDGKFATTDGQIIDAKDFCDYTLAPYGFVCIYDSTGHIGVEYELRNERFASGHLRNAVTLDQIFCAHPGCHELAQYGQFHHTIAVADGGVATSDTIIPLCKPHNAQNDDHKERNKNGWHGRNPITGEAGYNPPGSEEWFYNGHPSTAYSGRAIHLRHRKMREDKRRKAKRKRRRATPYTRRRGRRWL
ncbi:HNH endonuclease signature motif containing protein [Corynebacterium glucuronolyticum]|uniref:HNH endonuclease signature motif containing protein n=1 Tax=Corynebacterium glucuronolyticum TaxID=39791 RepID=UPI00223BE431|nr:HNH endonuclease signature motif containing protein [Corynebacterium glucuronolyticum]MCT1562232.1 HNH endonuclease [Corynebacterium glucuronolyticum]